LKDDPFSTSKALPEVPNTLEEKFKSFPVKTKKKKHKRERESRIAWAGGLPGWAGMP